MQSCISPGSSTDYLDDGPPPYWHAAGMTSYDGGVTSSPAPPDGPPPAYDTLVAMKQAQSDAEGRPGAMDAFFGDHQSSSPSFVVLPSPTSVPQTPTSVQQSPPSGSAVVVVEVDEVDEQVVDRADERDGRGVDGEATGTERLGGE